jgi:hypothetical protein
MTLRRLALGPLFLSALLALSGCPGEDRAGQTPCNVDEECAEGEVCFAGYCEIDTSSNTGGKKDAGTAQDAGPPSDAGTPPVDSGMPDAGAGPDAGDVDGGLLDSGAAPDSGFDAGQIPDAGSALDAASAADASTPPDAGALPDAGANSDSGANLDAGVPVDSGAVSDAGAAPDAAAGIDSGIQGIDSGVDSGVDGGIDAGLTTMDAGPIIPAFSFTESVLPEGGSADRVTASPHPGSAVNTYYALAYARRLFVRETSDMAWSECSHTFLEIDAFDSAGDDPDRLVVAANDDDVYQSTNGCQSFSAMNLLQDCEAVVALDGGNVLAGCRDGLFLYKNAMWVEMASPLSGYDVEYVASDDLGDDIVAAARGQGIIISTNGGNSWSSVTTGLPDLDFADVEINPLVSGEAWAMVSGGLYQWQAISTSWTQRHTQNGPSFGLRPDVDDTILSYDWGDLTYSTNGGASFSSGDRRNNGLQRHHINDIAFNAADPTETLVASNGGLYLTGDTDFNPWTEFNQGIDTIEARALASENPGRLWICARDGVYATGMAPATWDFFDGAVNTDNFMCNDIWISESDPDRVVVAGTALHVSLNGGANFVIEGAAGNADNWNFNTIAGRGNRIIAGSGKRLHRSEDGALNFTPTLIAGDEHNYKDLALGPGDDPQLLIAAQDGLWLSDLDLSGFTDLSIGLPENDVHETAIVQDGTFVVFTDGGLSVRRSVAVPWAAPLDPDCSPEDLVPQGEGVIVVCRDALLYWEPGMADVSPIANTPSVPIRSMVLEDTGQIWLGTRGENVWKGTPQ